MTELEFTQPEENLESTETTEGVEEQALQDATHEPGARIEETQSIEQAEAVEEELKEAMENTAQRQDDSTLPADELRPAASEESGGEGEDVSPIPLPLPQPADDGSEIMKDHTGTGGTVPGEIGVSMEPVPSPESPGIGAAEELGVNMEPIPSPENRGEARAGDLAVDMEPVPSPEERGGVLPVPIPEPAMDERGPGGGGNEVAATPINLPYPVDDSIEGGPGGRPGGDVSATPINLPYPVENQVEGGPGGGDVAATPINIPKPGGYEEEPPGGSSPGGDVAATPINLPYTPDAYELLEPHAQAVVDIISKAITNEEYRATLFDDARVAVAGYEVTDEDQTALSEMTAEAFDFFAAEVEARFDKAITGSPEGAQQQVMAQVVHAVWRDLNPGGLAYILAYKIPTQYLPR